MGLWQIKSKAVVLIGQHRRTITIRLFHSDVSFTASVWIKKTFHHNERVVSPLSLVWTCAGRRSQSSLCRSLQRAELLLRNTFSPSLKWLLHDPSQDEEENFILAHNLVSRSSVRLQRLQLTLLTLAPQWQLVGGAQMGPPQVRLLETLGISTFKMN